MNKHSSEIICHDNFNILCRVNDIMQEIIHLKVKIEASVKGLIIYIKSVVNILRLLKITKVIKIYCENMIKRLTLISIFRYY